MDLTKHLTTRADDGHASPVTVLTRHSLLSETFTGCQTWVRFFAYHRIKEHAPPLVRVPVNSFMF
jgi:hypothetical protein